MEVLEQDAPKEHGHLEAILVTALKNADHAIGNALLDVFFFKLLVFSQVSQECREVLALAIIRVLEAPSRPH